jgi:hypothetical protein
MPNFTPRGRNKEIHDALKKKDDQVYQETVIMQKVNKIHREAFKEKFPGQVEHILRLISERLQVGLDKRDNVTLTDVNTWILTPADINDLSEALYFIYQIHKELQSNLELEQALGGL